MLPKQRTTVHWRHSLRALMCVGLLGTSALTLAGCGSDTPPPNFAPLHYEYLSQFHLNVGSLSVVDNAPAGTVPGDISGHAPTPPDKALEQMAHDRLVAAGAGGTAIFTIDQASILHAPGGDLLGTLDVHLDIVTASGQHAGFAQAKVTRTFHPDSDSGDADNPGSLYTMTNQMMQDMNVELEFQIKRSLKDWLVDAGGAPIAGSIVQQDLGTPGAAASTVPAPSTDLPSVPGGTGGAPAEAAPVSDPTPAPAPTPAVVQPQEPDAIFPTGLPGSGTAATPSKGTSPQPGVLKLPASQTGSTTGSANGY